MAEQAPTLALELGTFMGYGAIRIARSLPPSGRLVSMEASAEQVGTPAQHSWLCCRTFPSSRGLVVWRGRQCHRAGAGPPR